MLQTAFINQLEVLSRTVDESPYLSIDGRRGIEEEIATISARFSEGILTFPQGEKTLSELNKRAAADEIVSLMSKIGHLNPSSPRLDSLRELSRQLTDGEISPEQARDAIQALMQG